MCVFVAYDNSIVTHNVLYSVSDPKLFNFVSEPNITASERNHEIEN